MGLGVALEKAGDHATAIAALERAAALMPRATGADNPNKLIAAIAAGKSVALISDAGTPLVSDPGYRLVRQALEAGLKVIPIPGASSVVACLMCPTCMRDDARLKGSRSVDAPYRVSLRYLMRCG